MRRPSVLVQFVAVAIVSVVSISALFVWFVVRMFPLSDPPEESKVVGDFRAHRAAYERVREMLLEDGDLKGVAEWGVETTGSSIWKSPPDGMQVRRYQEYLAPMKEIGAVSAFKTENPAETRFEVWESGFASDTRHVAVSWLDREPLNRSSSLSDFYHTEKPRNPTYVHIEDNWYIWADW